MGGKQSEDRQSVIQRQNCCQLLGSVLCAIEDCTEGDSSKPALFAVILEMSQSCLPAGW